MRLINFLGGMETLELAPLFRHILEPLSAAFAPASPEKDSGKTGNIGKKDTRISPAPPGTVAGRDASDWGAQLGLHDPGFTARVNQTALTKVSSLFSSYVHLIIQIKKKKRLKTIQNDYKQSKPKPKKPNTRQILLRNPEH